MNKVVIYIIYLLMLGLCSCKDSSVQDNVKDKVVDDFKLMVDENPFDHAQYFSINLPRSWTVKKLDKGIDFVTYSIDGSSSHIHLYVGHNPQSQVIWNDYSDTKGDVVSIGYTDDFDFGGTSKIKYKVHMMGLWYKVKNRVTLLYFEFSYDPQKSDESACENVIQSLKLLKSVPSEYYRPVDVF